MADWPTTEELAQTVDVTNVSNWETKLDRDMASAIRKVKSDVGLWDEDVDEPDENLAGAALRMGELLQERPTAAEGRVEDPTYQRLLSGHRRRFGIG